MSSMMSGRLVQPCPDCGARLRMSAMVLLSTTSAIGLIVTAIAYVYNPLMPLLAIALLLLGLTLFAMMSTRLEAAPAAPRGVPVHGIPPPRNEHPR
jgi:hypothetical protein